MFTAEEWRSGGFGVPRCPELASDERGIGNDVQSNYNDRLFHGVDHRLGNEGVPISLRETAFIASFEINDIRHFITPPYGYTYPRVGVHEHYER